MASVYVFVLIIVLSSGVLGRAMHTHPYGIANMYEESNSKDYSSEEEHAAVIDGMPIDVLRNIKPQRFVPINNAYFFTSYPDCEDGFVRDMLGICREVW